MGLLHEIERAAGKAAAVVRAGDDKLAQRKVGANGPPTLEVTSPDFAAGAGLPGFATAGSGERRPPRLSWRGAPAEARSFAVVCEDPDAPFPEPYVHWLVYGIAPATGSLDAAASAAAGEGTNSTMKIGFAPAAPPPGHGRHHYHFQVFALSAPVDLPRGAGRAELLDAIRGRVVAWGDLVGTCERT